MENVRRIEEIVNLFLALLEMQINTLRVMGRHQMRSDIVRYVTELVQSLLSSIDRVEMEFVSEIQEEAEKILGNSATLAKAICDVKNEMPQARALKELNKVATDGHRGLTASLSNEENRLITEVAERFSVMRQRVNLLHQSIKAM